MTHELWTTLCDAALRGASIALLLLMAAIFVRERPATAVARVGIAFAFGLVVQIAASAPTFEAAAPRLWQAPLVGVSVGNAVLFWLFAKALFDDDFAPRWWHAAVWFVVALVSARNCAVGWTGDSIVERLAIELQRAAPLLFAALAIVASIRTWRLDLVEKRRRLRVFIVVTGACYTVGMLVARHRAPHAQLGAIGSMADIVALTILVAIIAFGVLRRARSLLLGEAPAEPVDDRSARRSSGPRASDTADERLAAAVDRLMRDELAYRDEGMTLPALARRVGVPEHRLRRAINGCLGHRNFNAFVNAFRIEETRKALADPARRATPVLTIALTAGFQSIGPFNRAFKAATGMTPTEYRRGFFQAES